MVAPLRCETSGHAKVLAVLPRTPRGHSKLADRNFAQLKADPKHPSLHFKQIGTFWSARVGLHYRALATEVGRDLAWFWIGTHAEYDTLLSQGPANKRLQPTAARRPAQKRAPRRRG